MSMSSVLPFRDSRGDLWRGASKVNRRRPSEGQLADLFVERHCREVKFLEGHPRIQFYPARDDMWIGWNGEKWTGNEITVRSIVRTICREASEECGDPRIDSSRAVNAVLSLAKFDPRIFVSDWPCHPDLEAAVDGWISERCVLDPTSWTPRPAMLATTAGWERFDGDELSEALKARGIIYRRRGNVHGFDRLRLKDEADDE
jgi:hypothetical protein